MKAADERNRMAAMQHYDQYYGMPPQHGQANKARQGKNNRSATGKASGKTHGMVINPSAPKTYTVKKGDTLWSIAKKFLHTPSYWPEIWDKNQRIANPHLIRPGDILHFGYVKAAGNNGTGMKMTPRIRIERKGHGEPLSTLAPFLAWPRVLDDAAIKNAPYVLASQEDHTLIAEGERVYIKNIKNPRPGERHAIYHPEKPLHDPETGKLLGHQVDYVAYARIDVADKLSTATILDAKDAIRKGDRLFPEDKQAQALRAPIQLPRHKVRGQIVSLYQAKYLSADCMIVVINKGKQQGIKPGHTLGVYSEGLVVQDVNRRTQGTILKSYNAKTQLPPEKVAEAIVYNVGEQLSYAIILNADREVKNGDKIGNP
ncbi:MAG: LysM peptidoglycan-binding domain-containing protein [Thiolinea sp.]